MECFSFNTDGHPPLLFSVNPVYPGRLELQSGVVAGRTEGGRTYSYRKGPSAVAHTLRFEDMPGRDYDGGFDYATGEQAEGTQSLVNWFFNVAPPGTPFVYTDPFGASHTVEVVDSTVEFSLTGNGLYSGTLRLKETTG